MASVQDPRQKIEIAKQKKDTADQAFKKGDLQAALLNYHESIMYLQGIDKNMLSAMSGGSGAPVPSADSISTPGVDQAEKDKEKKEPSEVDDLLGKIYSNQSACHIKKGNWKRAIETAEKALAKNPSNYKAQFRKGKAQGEQGYVEKALATLEDLLTKDPENQASIKAEIANIKVKDKEREKKHNQKFKGFLNRKPQLVDPTVMVDSNPSTPSGSSSASVGTDISDASTLSVESAGTVPGASSIEPSGLVEVSEEEFERAKKAQEARS